MQGLTVMNLGRAILDLHARSSAGSQQSLDGAFDVSPAKVVAVLVSKDNDHPVGDRGGRTVIAGLPPFAWL
jgi:hypothetical protein